jgi:hypothetical protein
MLGPESDQMAPVPESRPGQRWQTILGIGLTVLGALIAAWFTIRPLPALIRLKPDPSGTRIVTGILVETLKIGWAVVRGWSIAAGLLVIVARVRKQHKLTYLGAPLHLVGGILSLSLLLNSAYDSAFVLRTLQSPQSVVTAWITKSQEGTQAIWQDHADNLATLEPSTLLAPETMADPNRLQDGIRRAVALRDLIAKTEGRLKDHRERTRAEILGLDLPATLQNGMVKAYDESAKIEADAITAVMQIERDIYQECEGILHWYADLGLGKGYTVTGGKILFTRDADRLAYTARMAKMSEMAKREDEIVQASQKREQEDQERMKKLQNL